MVPEGTKGKTKNVQDAIAFLRSARMLEEREDGLRVTSSGPFRPALLRALRRVQADDTADPLDRLYMGLLQELFIRPNWLFRTDLHAAANSVSGIPVSHERINAWARVLEHLGVGRRAGNGFQCAYAPELVRELLALHPRGTHELDVVLDEVFEPHLPVRARDGDITKALYVALVHLSDAGATRLLQVQDSPSRRYGPAGYTHVRTGRRRAP